MIPSTREWVQINSLIIEETHSGEFVKKINKKDKTSHNMLDTNRTSS